MRRILWLTLSLLALLVLVLPVYAQETPATPGPDEVIVTPPGGPRGTEHVITFSGTPGEIVTVTFTYEGQVVYETTTTISPEGIGSTNVFSEDTDPLGIYTVTITRSDGSQASGTLEITAAEPPATATEAAPPPAQPGEAEVFTGTLAPDMPIAEFTISGTAGERLTLRLESMAFDPYLLLFAPDGAELARDDDGGGSLNAQISDVELPADGDYVVRVTSARYAITGGLGASGDFVLTITRTAASEQPPTETPEAVAVPGGSTIAYGDQISGSLTEDTPEVRYTFAGAAGDVVTVSVTSDNYDPYVVLLAPDGEELAADDDSGGGLNARIAGYSLAADGDYTLVVTSFTYYVNGTVSRAAAGDFVLTLESGAAAVRSGGALVYGDVVDGVFADDPDGAEYTFSGRAGDAVTISAESSDFDTYLVLTGPDGTEVATDDDTGEGLNALIENFVLPADGEYTILLTSFSNIRNESQINGAYTLRLLSEAEPVVVQPPPTATPEAPATPEPVVAQDTGIIRFGDTLSVTLDNSGRGGRYIFEGHAGDIVTVTMLSEDFDAFLIVYDQRGDEVARDDDAAGDRNAQVQFLRLPSDGVYTINATSFENATAGLPVSGSFLLTLTLDRAAPRPLEPGAEITYGDSVNGIVDEANPSGVTYTFTGAAGDIVRIRAESADFDAYLALFDASGSLLTEDDDSGGNLAALIDGFVLPADGSYTILVTSREARNQTATISGAFTLTLEQVQVVEVPPVDGGSIAYGDSVDGELAAGQSGVAYTFAGSAGDRVTIRLESAAFDAFVVLLDPDGNEIAINDDGAGGSDALLENFPLPVDGDYTLIATSFGWRASSSTAAAGAFTLSLESGAGIVAEDTIGYGETVEGTLNDSPTGATYSFEGSAGDVVTITVDSTDFDTYLVLLDVDGAEIAFNDDSRGSLNSQILAFELPADGTYTILVTSFLNRANGDPVTGSFVLTLEAEGAGPVVVDEGSIAYGQTVEGEFDEDPDGAEYTFAGSAGDIVTITLESDDFDTYLVLLDEDGNELAANDDSGGTLNSQIADFELRADGTYTIVVTSFPNRARDEAITGAYTLTLEGAGGGPVVVEGETLAYGQSVDGEVEDDPDGAVYTFEGSAGDVVTITLESPDFDTFVILLDANGDEIAADDDSAGNLNSRIEAFELPEDGTYSIVVSSFGNRSSGEPITGTYTLTLELGAGPVEPGEFVVEDAGSIGIGDTVSAEFGGDVQANGYTFEGEAGTTITITLTSGEFDAYLILQDAEDNEIIADDDSGGNFNSQIVIELPYSGTYRIIATSFTYVFVGEGISGEYTLNVVEGEAPVVVPGAALAYGDSVSDNLSAEGVQEVPYTFEGRAGDVVTITLESPDFDPFVALLGPDGRELAADDDGAGNLNARITGYTLPADGRYTIVVTSYSARNDGPAVEGAYTLTLETGTPVVTPTEGRIEYGQNVQGVLPQGVPFVEYRFSGSAGDTIIIDMRSGEFDTFLTLVDANGFEIAYNDDSGGTLNSRIGPFTLPASGEYIIRASSFAQAGTGSFTLSLTRVIAQPVVSGEPVVVEFAPGAQIASLTFDAQAGDYLTVVVDSGGGLDTRLELLAPDGQFLFADDDSGAGYDPEIVRLPLPASGTYALVLSPYVAGEAGNVTVTVTVAPAPSLDEGPQTVRLSDKQPVQFLTLTGSPGEAVRITVRAAGSITETYVSVFDGDRRIAFLAFAGVSENSFVLTLPADGRYTVRLENYTAVPQALEVTLERNP